MADSSVRDEIIIDKGSLAVFKEAVWSEMVKGCRRVEVGKDAVCITRDDLTAEDIQDILKLRKQA